MKTLLSRVHVFICVVMLITLSDSIAADGVNIAKKYHIRKPEGQRVDVKVHLTEASGLALSAAGKSLWTVSDSRKNYAFKMSLQGKPKDSESFEIVNYPYDRPDIEGVCLSDDGKYMYLVQERELAIVKILVTPEALHATMIDPPVLLSSLKNYSTLVQPYLGGDENAGLEGITFHPDTKDIYVVVEKVEKDGKKGPLIIQINNNLSTIIDSRFLSGDTGFVGDNGDTTIDGSGIDFDRTSQDHYYIVSDEGKRLFLYDWKNNVASPEIDLNYSHAEGVAYDPIGKMVYIVTDGGNNQDSKLYAYEKK